MEERDKGQDGKGQGEDQIRSPKPEIRNDSAQLDAGKSKIRNPNSKIDSSFILEPSSFVFITVAEPSADQHAAKLIQVLRQWNPEIRIEGIGGEKMRGAGAVIHHESTSRAAMGWRAAMRAGEVSRWLRWTRHYFDRHRPALHICCDSWSMNWHFAKLAHQRGIPVLYYIAPQTWASRESRVYKIKRYVDKLACILPFEEQYFRKFGIDANYVGHPLFDELPARNPKSEIRNPKYLDKARHRQIQNSKSEINSSFSLRPSSLNSPVIGLLPGSRIGVVRHNFPHLLDVARRIRGRIPGASFRVPTTPVTHELVQLLSNAFPDITIRRDGFDEIVPQCDFCITVSGTAALHVAAYGVPFVVVYRVPRLHWHLVGRWVVKTRTYSLVNILSGGSKKIVPEFIPWYGSNQPLADRVMDYLTHPEKMAEQRRQLAEAIRQLEHPGASVNVARLVVEMLAGATADRMSSH